MQIAGSWICLSVCVNSDSSQRSVRRYRRSLAFRLSVELLAKWSNGQRRASSSDGRTFHQSEFWHLALDAREQFQRMWKLEVRWNGWNGNWTIRQTIPITSCEWLIAECDQNFVFFLPHKCSCLVTVEENCNKQKETWMLNNKCARNTKLLCFMFDMLSNSRFNKLMHDISLM